MIQFGADNGLFESALAFAEEQVRRLIEKYPDFYPMYTKNGRWRHEGAVWTEWCDGFLPGMMWIFHRRAEPGSEQAKFWYEQAVRYTKPLAARKDDREIHDLGFIFLPTFYRWYQLTKDPELNDVLVEAGKTLALRYNEKGQFLRSFVAENSLFIDLMMNVGLVFYAARETNDKRLRDIGVRHSVTTRRFLVRGDGSTAHEGVFDLRTGAFIRQTTHQGYRSDSCWSRGLTWALYGFITTLEYTRDPRFLATAEACADYYISHCHADGVPPWDFNTPADTRTLLDTSAAAIAAAGLNRLCRIAADPMKGHFYWATAQRILRTLCERYTAKGDPRWEGVLKSGVYHLNRELGVDESVIWGDYFFVEALDRALRGS